MKELKNSFSLRETLEIIFPGLYFMSLLIPIFDEKGLSLITSNEIPNIALYLMLSLVYGVVLYVLDIPKKIPFFRNNTPTYLLEKEFENIDKTKKIIITNAYFSFYDSDEISIQNKNKTEIYTSIYHFSINCALTSFLLLIIYFITIKVNFCSNEYVIANIIVFCASIFNSVFIVYSPKKIKYMFERQIQKFKGSDYYKTLITPVERSV